MSTDHPRRGEVVLSLREVTKEFPLTPPLRVLDRISFEVGMGELMAVVGPSGSGKSTLLHIMGTLDRPSEGKIEVAGYAINELSDRKLSAIRSQHIGFVFQSFFLQGGLSATENVSDGMLYTGAPIRERRAAARRALRQVGLGHRLDHPAFKLSGGEQQRVAIARALVGNPSIILADEPTGNLDSKASDSIVGLLEELNRGGSTIVVITHDLEVAARFPRKVEVRDGRISHDSAA